MYASQMSINSFRRFTNTKLRIGKYVTCIAGQNGVGKSQILALLGNCGQLTKKQGESIQGYPFRADWSEIVKGDINHDNLNPVKNAISQNGVMDALVYGFGARMHGSDAENMMINNLQTIVEQNWLMIKQNDTLQKQNNELLKATNKKTAK